MKLFLLAYCPQVMSELYGRLVCSTRVTTGGTGNILIRDEAPADKMGLIEPASSAA